MQAVGYAGETLREMAFMGFLGCVECRTILKPRLLRRDIAGYSPDAVILIDYPALTLR